MFLKQDLDNICLELCPDAWINPHRSILGLGNYDINVIMKALLTKDCETEWFDKRKDPGDIEFNDKRIVGFILNVPSEYKFGFVSLPLHHRRHWCSLKKVGNAYYSLDSKLKDPLKIGSVRHNFISNHYRINLFFVSPSRRKTCLSTCVPNWTVKIRSYLLLDELLRTPTNKSSYPFPLKLNPFAFLLHLIYSQVNCTLRVTSIDMSHLAGHTAVKRGDFNISITILFGAATHPRKLKGIQEEDEY